MKNVDSRLVIVVVATVLAATIDIIGIDRGLSLITPHLFYLPIILASYLYPRRGVIFAVFVGFLNLIAIFLIGPGDLPMLTYATATASFYVLVAVSVVTSSISGSLHQRDLLYKGVFDHSEAGVFVINDHKSDPLIKEVNARGAGMLDYRPSELEGMPASLLWSDETDYALFLSALNRQGAVRNHETTFLNKGKRGIPVLISAGELPESTLVITILDITTRKQIERDMAEKNRQLNIINQLITTANGASSTQELMGTTLENIRDIMHCEFSAVYLEDDGTDLSTPSFVSPPGAPLPAPAVVWGRETSAGGLESQFFKGSPIFFSTPGEATVPGGIHTAALVPLLCGNRQIGVLYVASTMRQEMDADEHSIMNAIGKEVACALMKLRLTEEIHEANRMANLYLDVLVHDINNANMAAQGYGHLLLEMVDGPPKDITRKMMEGVRRSSEVLKNLDIVRKIHERPSRLTDVNLDPVIRHEIRHYPGAKIHYSGTRAAVSADELLGAVFSNLIQNSLKFGGADVRITIDVIETGSGRVQVEVIDTGPGIPDTIKPVLFSRFQSADVRTVSTATTKGLGLYIVKSLVNRYQGEIKVEDRVSGHPEQGTTFRIILHAARMAAIPRKV